MAQHRGEREENLRKPAGHFPSQEKFEVEAFDSKALSK